MSKQDGSGRQVTASDVDDSSATVLHVDMDAFFASVELLERPDLRGRPVIVAHDGPRSVVTAATYEARKFGVNSAMPLAIAKRRCPQAVILEPHFDRYQHYSAMVMAICDELTPSVERLGIDEAFLDVAGARRHIGGPIEVATILRNTITTTSTLEDREDRLKALFNDVSKLATVTERFTRANGDNLVRLADLGAAQLEVFARYAPGYPCLLGGIVGAGKLQAEAFRGFTLHIVLETLPNQPRGYGPQDVPVYGDKRGYHCGTLPSPPWSQSNPLTSQPDFVDGVDEPTGKGTSRVGPGWSGTAAGFAGGRDESALLKSLLAPGLGVSTDDVPDLGVLLVGPMARGAEVSLR